MGSNRKNSIISEAIAATSVLGFKRTNARSIAERLSIQPSNVFYYFKTEQELTKAMLEQIVLTNNDMVEKFSEKRNPTTYRQKLASYILGNLEWAARHPESVNVLLFGICEGQSDSNLLQLISKALSQGEEKVYNMIVAGLAEGEFTINVDLKPREVAKALHQSIIGQTVRSVTEQSSVKLYHKRMTATLDCFISE